MSGTFCRREDLIKKEADLFNIQNAPSTVGTKRRVIQKVAESQYFIEKVMFKTIREQNT